MANTDTTEKKIRIEVKDQYETSEHLSCLFRSFFCVDRTEFIKIFMDWKVPTDDSIKTLFIAAPYSFGKSSNLELLESFYGHKEQFMVLANSYKDTFGSELRIMKDEYKGFRDENMGKYLVLLFDFRDIASRNQAQVQNSIIDAAYEAALKHKDRLSESNDLYIKQLLNQTPIEKDSKHLFCCHIGKSLVNSLKDCARNENKLGCIVLIDEFDLLAEQFLKYAMEQSRKKKTENDIEGELADLALSYDAFLSNITDKSQVFKCLAVGRTQYGSASSTKVKKIKYIDFLQNFKFATSFGLTKKQVEELLTRRMILIVCDMDAENIKFLFKKISGSNLLSANDLSDQIRSQLPAKTDEEVKALIEQTCGLLGEMETYFNGFIVRDNDSERIFAFSSVFFSIVTNYPEVEFNFQWKYGAAVDALASGLSLLDFGFTVFNCHRKKEMIVLEPSEKFKIGDLVKVGCGLADQKISGNKDALNIYKQYLQDLGFFTKIKVTNEVGKNIWTMKVPNEHILQTLKKLSGLEDFYCSNESIVSLQNSILKLIESQTVNEDSAQRFLFAFSCAFSKTFERLLIGGKMDECNLRGVIYSVLLQCSSKFNMAGEIHIPFHAQIGKDICSEATSDKPCGCDRRYDTKVDFVLTLDDCIIIFELKVDKTAKVAMSQIGEKGYFQIKRLPEFKNKHLIAIGMNYTNSSDKIQATFLFNKLNSSDYKASTIIVYECNRAVA